MHQRLVVRASGIKTCCCYGGASKGPQAMALRDGVHGVIGCPAELWYWNCGLVVGARGGVGSICWAVKLQGLIFLDHMMLPMGSAAIG